jgi:PadR family transcriptional regulator, regulatory protein PadR
MKLRNRPPSKQTLAVLFAIANARADWSYGMEISKATGLKSGSLYPILMRCDERGLLESCWLEPERPGRPPRHGYRITKAGVAVLDAARASQSSGDQREAFS